MGIMKNILTIVRGNCTETYSADWLGKNRLIRCGKLLFFDGGAPFSSALFPRYGSETQRNGIPAWYRFRNAAEMTLELLLDGEMRYTQDQITETVRPGEVYIIHKGSDTMFEQLPGQHFHRLRLMLCPRPFRSSWRANGSSRCTTRKRRRRGSGRSST